MSVEIVGEIVFVVAVYYRQVNNAADADPTHDIRIGLKEFQHIRQDTAGRFMKERGDTVCRVQYGGAVGHCRHGNHQVFRLPGRHLFLSTPDESNVAAAISAAGGWPSTVCIWTSCRFSLAVRRLRATT